MAKAMNTSVELYFLTLVRKAHTISLLAGLALALSGMSCESPTRSKLSPAKSGVEKSTGKPGNGSLEMDGTRAPRRRDLRQAFCIEPRKMYSCGQKDNSAIGGGKQTL